MTRGTTSILYLFEGAFSLWRRRLKGVYAAARERGWHVEPVNADDEGVTSNAVLHFWRPDGVIVDGAALRSSIRPRRTGSRTRSRSSAASRGSSPICRVPAACSLQTTRYSPSECARRSGCFPTRTYRSRSSRKSAATGTNAR